MTEANHIQDLTLRVHDAESRAAKYLALLQEAGNWKHFKDILVWRRKIKELLPKPVTALNEVGECPRCEQQTLCRGQLVDECTYCGYRGIEV